MADLVVGDKQLALAVGHGGALEAGDDAVDGVVDLLDTDAVLAAAPLNPGARMATTLSNTSGSSFLLELCTLWISSVPRMSGSPTLTADLPIEAARAEQRGIEDLRPVCGRHDDDAAVSAEPVHLRQEASSWFSVCSRSSFPPPMPVPCWRPTAST